MSLTLSGIEGLVMTKAPPSPLSKDNVFLVPYDKDGKLDPRKRMTLDLRCNNALLSSF